MIGIFKRVNFLYAFLTYWQSCTQTLELEIPSRWNKYSMKEFSNSCLLHVHFSIDRPTAFHHIFFHILFLLLFNSGLFSPHQTCIITVFIVWTSYLLILYQRFYYVAIKKTMMEWHQRKQMVWLAIA